LFCRNERSTSQGQIGLKLVNDSNTALMIELNCETDFVAKNDIFKDGVLTFLDTLEHANDCSIKLADKDSQESKELVLALTLSRPLDVDLSEMSAKDGLTYLISKTRENCNIGSVVRHTTEEGQIFGNYLHWSGGTGLCKTGSLVLLNSSNSQVDLRDIANTIAMHIVAMRPLHISKEHITENAGKVKDNEILLHQELVSPDSEDGVTVQDWLKKQGEQHKTQITVEDFSIFSCA
jgi:elongation factor Ts